MFSLNDGIYDLDGSCIAGNFSGTLTLFRNDLIQIDEDEDSVTVEQRENKILVMEVINGDFKNDISEILLDNGDYFWEWSRSDSDGNIESEISVKLSGEVFSPEQEDREIIVIGRDDPDMPLVSGSYIETLEGEVGFCNNDAIYQYITDGGGELSLTIRERFIFRCQTEGLRLRPEQLGRRLRLLEILDRNGGGIRRGYASAGQNCDQEQFLCAGLLMG